MDKYKDIRPYHDDEVADVLQRLAKDDDFIQALCSYRLPRLSRFAPFLAKPLLRFGLAKQLKKISGVEDLQTQIAAYVERMIASTTAGVSFSGLQNLNAQTNYLYMANHRDIAMDPTFINYALYQQNLPTPHVAIGDNLLERPFVSDLMRLNKCFIVRRSVEGRREKLAAFVQLSSYINDCLNGDQSIWIAQSEGRAKDGNDLTDVALIKMLMMSQKGRECQDVISSLNIVPVAISYEFNPCDAMIARELYEKEKTGEYIKAEGEDDRSIMQGMSGFKGRVHLAFGEPLREGIDTPAEVAASVDAHILSHYKLFPSNYLAFAKLKELYPEIKVADLAKHCQESPQQQQFEERLAAVPSAHQEWFLKMYAAPVINHYR